MRPLLALLVLPLGCVTQGTFDKLKADYDASQEQLAERNKKLSAQEQENLRQKRDQGELQAALNSEKETAKDLQARIAKMEGEKATMLKDKSSLQAAVGEMTAALAELQRRKAEADARIAEFKSVLDKFKVLIDAGKLNVKIVDGRMVVVLASDVLFGSGSANLSKDGKAAIAEVSGLLASIPKRKFQVEGHTDNVPIATAQYPSNWELASSRALTVLKTMTEAGMPIDRISAASFGDSKPAAANDSTEGKAANRRIEIIIVPDLSTLPGFEELNRIQKK
jgi:chemotaxis protein MotB